MHFFYSVALVDCMARLSWKLQNWATSRLVFGVIRWELGLIAGVHLREEREYRAHEMVNISSF
jgi:hypothetical protein